MAKTSYLSATQKQSLIDWIGVRGEGYPAYLEWVEREQIPEDRVYSVHSYRSWVQRRRTRVQASREVHRAETRRQSRLDREARMKALESTFQNLDTILKSGEVTESDKIIRLEEQKRKTLEAIAKERGEWGVKAAETEDRDSRLDVFFQKMAKGNVTPIRQAI